MADPLNSPLMLQYREIKSRHQDAILFFRMGDFYEMFFDDAERAAKLLSITLTSRGDGIPLAGVPVKAAAEYLRQLVGAGLRVAICEQVEDPKLAKGIVKREVIETITPGALLEEGWLAGARNNYLVAVGLAPGGPAGQRASGAVGLAAVDLSTGEFLLETLPAEELREALSRLAPAEVASPADAELDVERRRSCAPRGSGGSSTPRWPARNSPAASTLPRSTALASGPPTIPPSAPRAPCSATSPSCSPAGSSTSPARPCAAPRDTSGSTR